MVRFSTTVFMLFFQALSFVQSGCANEDDNRRLLAFTEAWLNPQDYAWNRESRSRLSERDKNSVLIRDFGRVRVEFVKIAGESAELCPRILKYHYETQLPGEPLQSSLSPFEGQELPHTWLHAALGFSIGVNADQKTRIGESHHQAMEVLDLLDFRGFVPDEVPVSGKEWRAYTERKSNSTYLSQEVMERNFRCESVEASGEDTLCLVHFDEIVKITPQESSRTSELRERTGWFKVRMPQGLIEEVSWESTATEYMTVENKRSTILTETKTSIVRRDVPPPKQRTKKAEKAQQNLPRPPR